MNKIKRAYTRTELLHCGLSDYKVPIPGIYNGTLDYKQWGKSVNMWIYLTLDSGDKIKLSCFRSRKNSQIYSARDELYNFAILGNEGSKFKLIIANTKNNKIAFESAIFIS
jgi:hypothetical protein